MFKVSKTSGCDNGTLCMCRTPLTVAVQCEFGPGIRPMVCRGPGPAVVAVNTLELEEVRPSWAG